MAISGSFRGLPAAPNPVTNGLMEEQPTSELLAIRRRKLDALRESGIDPFGSAFPTDGVIEHVRDAFTEAQPVRAAGRITAHRDMGKSHFLDLSDFTGRIQLFLHAKEVGETAYQIFQSIDLGDWVGVEGEYFTTKTGELSIRVKSFTVLSKSLRPLPEKWHGIQDAETKYRQRHLDLIANPPSREIFHKRIRWCVRSGIFWRTAGFWKWRRR